MPRSRSNREREEEAGRCWAGEVASRRRMEARWVWRWEASGARDRSRSRSDREGGSGDVGRGVRVSVPPLEGLLAWVWAGLAGLVASWAGWPIEWGFLFCHFF